MNELGSRMKATKRQEKKMSSLVFARKGDQRKRVTSLDKVIYTIATNKHVGKRPSLGKRFGEVQEMSYHSTVMIIKI